MDTFAVTTLDFAKAYGVYILVTGLAGLFAPDRWKLVMDDYARSPGLTYLTAVIVFGLGLVLVMLHNLWTDPLAVIVSLIGWIVLIEGIALMALPEALLKFGGAAVASHSRVRLWAIFALIAGAILLAAAFTGHATVTA
ncbi:MAG: hypothetical protein KBF30_06160 [Hyphomonadaceae bacterium]|nr:hypothetical protein [Hyphomonadaceae bacterium]